MNQKYKYGIVILHYLTYKDTIECINSIVNNYNEDFAIVVVDNYSNNGSIEKVEMNFSSQKNIYFLKNSCNLGFAQGNNIGYKFCKNELKCNFIIITNNDIIFKSKNMFNLIEMDFKKDNCAVLGPDIVSLIDRKSSKSYETRKN